MGFLNLKEIVNQGTIPNIKQTNLKVKKIGSIKIYHHIKIYNNSYIPIILIFLWIIYSQILIFFQVPQVI